MENRMNPLDELEYMVGGAWIGTGELREVGEFTQEDKYEWTLGDKFIRCMTKVTFPDFSFEAESLVCRNPDDESLAFWYFSDDGSYSSARGEIVGKTLVFEGTTVGSGPKEGRFTLTKTGEDSRMFSYYGRKDGKWVKHYELEQKRLND